MAADPVSNKGRHPLTWLYRKLGRRYPSVFITVELQTAFLVAIGAVALFSAYYSVSGGGLPDDPPDHARADGDRGSASS